MDPINIPPMLAYIAYMDPMGIINGVFPHCYVWWPEGKYYQVTTPTWQKTLSAVEPVVGIYINQPENLIHQLGYKPKIDV